MDTVIDIIVSSIKVVNLCLFMNFAVYTSRHFDGHGNYFSSNDPDSIQDNWLTDVDWNKVKLNDSSLVTSSTSSVAWSLFSLVLSPRGDLPTNHYLMTTPC